MAAALVVPTLLFPHSPESASLADLVRRGRETAAARGEALLLRVDGAGRWDLRPAADPSAPPLAQGTVTDTSRISFTLRFTPTGLCAPVPSPGTERVALDPLDCATPP